MPTESIFKNKHCEWIDVEGATQEDLDFLHDRYQLNDLWLEDTIDANHLPKYEEDESVKFFLLRENTELERASLNTISDVTTKLGIFILNGLIITIHRMKNSSISNMRKEVHQNPEEFTAEKIALGLAVIIMKSFDDEAINILEVIDNLENEIFLKNTNSSNQLRRLYRLKRKTGLNFRILNMSADAVDKFKRLNISDSEIIDLKDKYKDVVADFDHLQAQVLNLISMFLALSDQKANQTMKLLTQFSVYFLPITFIAGVYGMNFDNMPELREPMGYFATLGVMAIVVMVIFIYMRRKKW